jgi:hypothetical protein
MTEREGGASEVLLLLSMMLSLNWQPRIKGVCSMGDRSDGGKGVLEVTRDGRQIYEAQCGTRSFLIFPGGFSGARIPLLLAAENTRPGVDLFGLRCQLRSISLQNSSMHADDLR